MNQRNTPILDQYEVKFDLKYNNGQKEISVESSAILLLGEFLWYHKVPQDIDEIIVEMTKAINKQPFDAVWSSPVNDEFHIGHSTTTFKYHSGNYADYLIPTVDVKEILIAYRDWVVENGYENYVKR